MTENLFSMRDNKPTASDLSAEYTISDTAAYIKNFRQSFLRRLREDYKLSESDVCQKSGIPMEDLQRIERGKVSETDLMNLQKLSKVYDISYHYLLALFKLAKRPQEYSELKMAAYHEAEIDKYTSDQVVEFIKDLMGK
jgi:transcriptional regulator with XRE-family HTH domain